MATIPAPLENPPQPLRKIEALEAIVRSRPGGAALLDELLPLADEVQFLVQRNRRVATVWQRHAGPAFARAIVESGFDEWARIPKSIQAASLEGLLLAMADALQRHGSLALRRAIADNAYELLRCARECSNFRELIDALAASRSVAFPTSAGGGGAEADA